MYIIEPVVELRYSPIKNGKSQISNLSVALQIWENRALTNADAQMFLVAFNQIVLNHQERQEREACDPCSAFWRSWWFVVCWNAGLVLGIWKILIIPGMF